MSTNFFWKVVSSGVCLLDLEERRAASAAASASRDDKRVVWTVCSVRVRVCRLKLASQCYATLLVLWTPPRNIFSVWDPHPVVFYDFDWMMTADPTYTSIFNVPVTRQCPFFLKEKIAPSVSRGPHVKFFPP